MSLTLFVLTFFVFLCFTILTQSAPNKQYSSPLKDGDFSESLKWFQKVARENKWKSENGNQRREPPLTIEQVADRMKTLVERILSCRPIPSMTVAIVNLTSSATFVVQTNGTQNYSTRTNYGIGSISKGFTAFLVSQLKDQKLLSLEAPIRHYIPGFELMSATGGSVWLTFEDLLSHRSGLPDHGYDSSYVYGTNFTRGQLFDRLKFLQPSAQLRTKWQYNNLACTVPGLACSNILSSISKTEVDWEQAVYDYIFEPLGMRNTYGRLDDAKTAGNLAQPHLGQTNPQGDLVAAYEADYEANRCIQVVAPSGGIYSNVEDMSKWIQVHLNKGKSGSQSLISEESLENIISPHITLYPKNSWENFYSPVADSNITFSRYSYGIPS